MPSKIGRKWIYSSINMPNFKRNHQWEWQDYGNFRTGVLKDHHCDLNKYRLET